MSVQWVKYNHHPKTNPVGVVHTGFGCSHPLNMMDTIAKSSGNTVLDIRSCPKRAESSLYQFYNMLSQNPMHLASCLESAKARLAEVENELSIYQSNNGRDAETIKSMQNFSARLQAWVEVYSASESGVPGSIVFRSVFCKACDELQYSLRRLHSLKDSDLPAGSKMINFEMELHHAQSVMEALNKIHASKKQVTNWSSSLDSKHGELAKALCFYEEEYQAMQESQVSQRLSVVESIVESRIQSIDFHVKEFRSVFSNQLILSIPEMNELLLKEKLYIREQEQKARELFFVDAKSADGADIQMHPRQDQLLERIYASVDKARRSRDSIIEEINEKILQKERGHIKARHAELTQVSEAFEDLFIEGEHGEVFYGKKADLHQAAEEYRAFLKASQVCSENYILLLEDKIVAPGGDTLQRDAVLEFALGVNQFKAKIEHGVALLKEQDSTDETSWEVL